MIHDIVKTAHISQQNNKDFANLLLVIAHFLSVVPLRVVSYDVLYTFTKRMLFI